VCEGLCFSGNSSMRPVRNPYDPTRSAGGSSSGSGSLVNEFYCLNYLGTFLITIGYRLFMGKYDDRVLWRVDGPSLHTKSITFLAHLS
jgi:hypothetical protein